MLHIWEFVFKLSLPTSLHDPKQLVSNPSSWFLTNENAHNEIVGLINST